MGQARRRGDFDARRAESEFYANEQKRLDAWMYENRPVVVSIDTNSGSLQRAVLISALCGVCAFVSDKDGNRIG